MAEHNLEHTIALFALTLVALDGMLRGLPDKWIMRNEGETLGTCSGFSVIWLTPSARVPVIRFVVYSKCVEIVLDSME